MKNISMKLMVCSDGSVVTMGLSRLTITCYFQWVAATGMKTADGDFATII